MSNISFFHIASVYPKATENVVRNIRKYHADSFYHLAVDATDNYEYLAENYNLNYRYYTTKMGGPVGNYGYKLSTTLEFLYRFKFAAEKCKTSHMMMVEDDVLIINPVTVDSSWEMACHNISVGNEIPKPLRDIIEHFSGVKMEFIRYGAGGGSIFKVSTFLENYDNIVKFLKNNFDMIQNHYPTIGYIDCFMNIYYYLCGKKYTINPYLTDTHNHQPGFDYESFISSQPKEIQIINNYKKYYYE